MALKNTYIILTALPEYYKSLYHFKYKSTFKKSNFAASYYAISNHITKSK